MLVKILREQPFDRFINHCIVGFINMINIPIIDAFITQKNDVPDCRKNVSLQNDSKSEKYPLGKPIFYGSFMW